MHKLEMNEQRSNYEDILKISAANLSNKTEATDLVKMLRMCSYIERQDPELSTRLVEHLRPKIFQLDNDDLTQLFTPLVLMAQQGVWDDKLIKTLERSTLGKAHSMSVSQVARILKAYSLLKIPVPKSISLVKALQGICLVKVDEFSMDQLMMCISALIRFHNHKMEISDQQQAIRQLLETLCFNMVNENRSGDPANLAELYNLISTSDK